MKSLSKRNKIVLIISSVILLAVVGLLALLPGLIMNDAPQGMRQVKSYNANGICQAVDNPECGYCPGEVIEGKCYAKQGALEQYP